MARRTVLLGLTLLLVACTSQKAYTGTEQTSSADSVSSASAPTAVLVSPNGEKQLVHVEIARTPAEQEHGLMGRASLASDAGMLFVFNAPQPLDFWMKNTLIPLDILFFGADGAFVSMQTMQPCSGDPCSLYSSGAPALYALEVDAGYAAARGVGSGWKLEVQ